MSERATIKARGGRLGAVLVAAILPVAVAPNAVASETTYYGEVRCDRQRGGWLPPLGVGHREYQYQMSFSSSPEAEFWIASLATRKEVSLELLGQNWTCTGVFRTGTPYTDSDY